MAKLHILLLLLLLLLSLAIAPSTADYKPDLLLQSEKPVRRPLREKLSHLRFYWHDILNGPSPTVVTIVPPPSNTTGFGKVWMMDDPLTLGPELSSKLVGRAQGFYCLASKPEVENLAILMAMNFAFAEGKYNGSTLAILGRNPATPGSGARELPVVGGSGLFRLARGYALLTTHSFDRISGNAVVEYNVFVTHY